MSYLVPRNKPNRCTDCPFMDRITYDCKLMYGDDYSDFESQYKHCLLIEIPTSHGKLIDADELKKKVLAWLPPDPCGQEEKEFPFETDICVSMLMEIEDAEPIIEAEGEIE